MNAFGEFPGAVLIAVHPRGRAGALHHSCEGVAVDRGSGPPGPPAWLDGAGPPALRRVADNWRPGRAARPQLRWRLAVRPWLAPSFVEHRHDNEPTRRSNHEY